MVEIEVGEDVGAVVCGVHFIESDVAIIVEIVERQKGLCLFECQTEFDTLTFQFFACDREIFVRIEQVERLVRSA